MSIHHQNNSPHLQFQQSAHRQRVCSGLSPCIVDGQFVTASHTITGWRGIGWDPGDLPEYFNNLYRHLVITHTKKIYHHDGVSGYVYDGTYWFKSTQTRNEQTGVVVYSKGEGSLNGLVYELDACAETTYQKPFSEWEVDSLPGGDVDDLPPRFGTYPSGGPADTNEFVSVSESTVLWRLIARDPSWGDQVFYELEILIEMSEPINVSTVADMVDDMLSSVPLTKTSYDLAGAVNVDDDAVTGKFGMVTKGADWNHVTLFYKTEGPCEARLIKIPHYTSQDDDACRCLNAYTGTLGTFYIVRDRKQTYNPANYAFLPPASGNTGAGSLRAVGTFTGVFYGLDYWWSFNAGSGEWEFNVLGDGVNIVSYDASARGKKALLARTDADDWTLLQQPDEEGGYDYSCLDTDPPETRCHRFYYPDGADTGGTEPTDAIYTIPASGAIYREIPDLTLDMSDDCPSPGPNEPDCPTGDGSEFLPDPETDNPCLPAPSPMAAASAPAPAQRWPLWAQAIKALAQPEDRGVGDTIARVIGPIGGDAYKAWRAKIGKPCKCPERQEKLNKLFPYTP